MKESKQIGVLLIGMFATLLVGAFLAYVIVDWRVQTMDVLAQESVNTEKREQSEKADVQSCHAEALKEAKAYHKFKLQALEKSEITSEAGNELAPIAPWTPIDFFDDEGKPGKGSMDRAIYFPDYEQYFILCIREKGFTSPR